MKKLISTLALVLFATSALADSSFPTLGDDRPASELGKGTLFWFKESVSMKGSSYLAFQGGEHKSKSWRGDEPWCELWRRSVVDPSLPLHEGASRYETGDTAYKSDMDELRADKSLPQGLSLVSSSVKEEVVTPVFIEEGHPNRNLEPYVKTVFQMPARSQFSLIICRTGEGAGAPITFGELKEAFGDAVEIGVPRK